MYTIKYKDNLIHDPRYGALAISPTLDLAVNTAGSLSFTLHPEHACYNLLNPLSSEIIVYRNDAEYWRGRVISIETDIFGQKKITCEGELAYLNDTVQRQARFYKDPSSLLTYLLAEHNADVKNDTGAISKLFTPGTVEVVDPDISLFRYPLVKAYPTTKVGTGIQELSINWLYEKDPQKDKNAKKISPKEKTRYEIQLKTDSYLKGAIFLWNATTKQYEQLIKDDYMFELNFQSTAEVVKDLLVDRLEGQLRVRHVNGVRYLDVLSGYTKTASQEIEFGKNLLDYTTDLDLSEVYTAVVPLGPEKPEWREITLEQSDDEKTQTKKNGITYDKWTDNELNKIYTLPTKDHKHYILVVGKDSKGKATYKYGKESAAWSNGLKTEIVPKDGKDYARLYNGLQSYRQRYKYEEAVNGRTINYVKNAENVKKYGFRCKVEYFEDYTTSADLKKQGEKWLAKQQFDDMSLEVKAIDFNLLYNDVVPFELLDLVRVKSEPFGLNMLFPIDSMSIDLANPAESTIGLNTTKRKTLTKKITSKIISSKSSAKKLQDEVYSDGTKKE